MNLEGRGCRCEFREEELHIYRLDAETEVSTRRSYPRGPGLWCPERSEGTTKGLEG